MTTFEAKSRPLWSTFMTAFIGLMIILVIGIFAISQQTFTKNMEEIVNIQTDVVNQQIVNNFEVYTNEIINISNQIQTKVSNLDLLVDKTDIEDLLETIIMLHTKYKRITLYSLDGDVLASSEPGLNIGHNILEEEWFIKAQEEQTTHYFSTPIDMELRDKITISKYIPTNKYQQYIVLKMDIDFSDMINIVNKSNLGVEGHISIINDNYEYIYTSKLTTSITDEEELLMFRNTILGNKEIKVKDQEMILIISTITNTPWRIGSYININDSILVRRNFVISTILFSVVFLVLSSLVFYTISKGITRPLNKLKDAMNNIEENEELDFVPVIASYPREVEILSYNYNKMMERIKSLMKRVIKEQDAQRKSELKALQNQINPHFLYNTLDSIVWMVENDENADASKMIMALSKLFKISISGGRNIITVKDELEHARSYLAIQQYRYKDKFTYEINVEDDAILNLDTMKLILQPLIENALYHGINKINDNGKITINVGMEEDLIKFSVADNGYGMTEERIEELYSILDNDDLSDGVGLKNIYQRLKVYYGKQSHLEIKSLADEGTRITIIVPAGDII